MRTNNLKATILLLAISALSLVGCKDGQPGAPGAAGTGNKIAQTINCSGTISGTGAPLDGLKVVYDVVVMQAGDVYATAAVNDDFAQVSSTAFYSVGQGGSTNGIVSLVFDYHNTDDEGTWDISLNRSSLVTSIVYTDPSYGAPENMTFTAASCTVQNW